MWTNESSERGVSVATAGYCAGCQTNVYLTASGGCPNGHPPESISDEYEVPAPIEHVVPAAPIPTPKKRRYGVIVAIVLALCVLALCAIVATVLVPLIGQSGQIAGEWRERLERDYPGWRPVGFNARSFAGSSGTVTEYNFALVPPDREFPVGVVYTSQRGEQPRCQDEYFRPAGCYHDRSESLLDYVEREYVAAGKGVASLLTENDGLVTVNWVMHSRVGSLSTGVGGYDQLEYDEDSGRWSPASAGGP